MSINSPCCWCFCFVVLLFMFRSEILEDRSDFQWRHWTTEYWGSFGRKDACVCRDRSVTWAGNWRVVVEHFWWRITTLDLSQMKVRYLNAVGSNVWIDRAISHTIQNEQARINIDKIAKFQEFETAFWGEFFGHPIRTAFPKECSMQFYE